MHLHPVRLMVLDKNAYATFPLSNILLNLALPQYVQYQVPNWKWHRNCWAEQEQKRHTDSHEFVNFFADDKSNWSKFVPLKQ
mmetsp:Transcript_153278/g.267872  ORF Transcript_153278/g.267872 Transcript_153278/m.267872 type:complete len:82 (-) Transcript_153278:1144-1389(-)